MCGIVGIISSNTISRDVVHTMTTKLGHRGPDAQALFLNESKSVGLGHTRLSIIDLSVEANQPFVSTSGRYVVIFNGEIYNFKSIRENLKKEFNLSFRTNSDTEVIAEAFTVWGTKMVNRFNGMFAIAVLDLSTNKLWLFRDQVGKKPIFYFKSSKIFAFASEIKSLLAHPEIKKEVTISKKSITSFLHLGYIPEPLTIYNEIYKFPSGSIGEIDCSLELQIKPYYEIDNRIKKTQPLPSIEKAKKELNELLNESVKNRLVSDVPLGAFLSGGADSSLITAIASKHVTGSLKTFSIGFHENKFDESRFAREVASHLKTQHTEYRLNEDEAIGLLESYLDHFDEPFADTSSIPTMLVSKLARKEVTVALTGDGGDELFQGYGAYSWANRMDNTFAYPLLKSLSYLLKIPDISRFNRVASLLRFTNKGGIRSHIFSQEQYFFSQEEIASKLLKNENDFFEFQYEDVTLSKEFSAGERQALFDLKYYLKDDLLVKVDRASMYYALECRSPFLDCSLIEFAFSLNESFKINRGVSKWILKEVLKDFLPEALVNRPKMGFSIPLERWLRNDLQYLIKDCLNEHVINDIGIINPTYLNQLKREFNSGQSYLYNRLWVIIVLQKWLMKHDSIPIK